MGLMYSVRAHYSLFNISTERRNRLNKGTNDVVSSPKFISFNAESNDFRLSPSSSL